MRPPRALPSPVIGAMLRRAHRANRIALRPINARHSSSAPRPPRAAGEGAPWWSLASLHARVATAIASSLPAASLSAVHRSLAERLDCAEAAEDRRAPASVGEAIVGARRRASASSPPSASDPRLAARRRETEAETEARALEKARERMRLELRAMEERWQRREAEREREERERK